MKKLFALAAILALLCTGCSSTVTQAEDDRIHILTTTYPVYLFTTAITSGMTPDETAGGVVEVELLVNEQVSCLHDYTLTVNDMKAIAKADIIVMNGAGFEDFMSDALAQTDAAVIDCSKGIDLLEACHEHDEHEHEHEHEYDPHIWMSPTNAILMCSNIAEGLTEYDAKWSDFYQENLASVSAAMEPWAARRDKLSALEQKNLITFHDGFQYFAADSGLTLLKSIEEEEGSEASAAEIKEIVALIEEYDIPAIFVEKNGSDSTAQAIARETGAAVYALDMMMSGGGEGLEPYLRALESNQDTIITALGG